MAGILPANDGKWWEPECFQTSVFTRLRKLILSLTPKMAFALEENRKMGYYSQLDSIIFLLENFFPQNSGWGETGSANFNLDSLGGGGFAVQETRCHCH